MKKVIIICLIVFIVINIGLFIWNKFIATSYSRPNDGLSTEIANGRWITYTTTDYHFSFKYPAVFIITGKKNVMQSASASKIIANTTAIQYTYTFSTGKMVNRAKDWSGFVITVKPTYGKTIAEQYMNEKGFAGKIGVTPLERKGNADEAAKTINSENEQRIYRVKDTFFVVSGLSNSNVLPDKSDDISMYFPQMFDSITFQK